jgi:hypothetical protein
MRMNDIRGRLLAQSLIWRLTTQSTVRSSVVVEVLPFTELLVEDLGIVDHDAVEKPVELLRVDPVRSLDLAVEPRRLRLDVFVSHPLVEHMPVERGLELRTVVGLDDVDAERESLEVLSAGHVPWFGSPARVSELLSKFVRSGSDGRASGAGDLFHERPGWLAAWRWASSSHDRSLQAEPSRLDRRVAGSSSSNQRGQDAFFDSAPL